jgi:hypothetical protein
MSVLGYLTDTASAAVLSGTEKESINKSVSALETRLSRYFEKTLVQQFRFGSSTRGTILPRSMDDKSDIDYMIVLKNDGTTAQTYLNRVKKFADEYYKTSEVYQSSPTIRLELNHIMFDLVPAIVSAYGSYQIPNGSNGWLDTDPNDFNKSLEEKNKSNYSLIKPTIRLVKYWNAQNGYLYNSYEFEKWIINQGFYGCSNQKDYLFKIFDTLSTANEQTQWRKDKINRAKTLVDNVRYYEQEGKPITAETEVKKLITARSDR